MKRPVFYSHHTHTVAREGSQLTSRLKHNQEELIAADLEVVILRVTLVSCDGMPVRHTL
jgi:hypothetical protein